MSDRHPIDELRTALAAAKAIDSLRLDCYPDADIFGRVWIGRILKHLWAEYWQAIG